MKTSSSLKIKHEDLAVVGLDCEHVVAFGLIQIDAEYSYCLAFGCHLSSNVD